MPTKMKHSILKKLDNGLILRRSTIQDADQLAEFNSMMHSDDGPEKPDERVGIWAKDLLVTDHPTFGEGDYTIVAEEKTGKIVSSMNLISQTWQYEGIPFKVGRPELVGTLVEYRNRGLVRLQFEEVHKWSAERGEIVQAITGIPYYYRLFGYEMTLNLDGGRAGFKPHLPKLKEGEEEPFLIRPVTLEDIPFIYQTYMHNSRRYLIRCQWDERLLEYEILKKSPRNINRFEFRILETKEHQPIGFFGHPGWTWGTMLPCGLYELKEGFSYGEVTPVIMRYLIQTGEAYALRDKVENFDAFGFWLGAEHPVYEVAKDRLPRVRPSYAWYIRIPDLVGFLQLISPALEDRLERSAYCGHSAEIKITFYRDGVKLVLEKGKLVKIEPHRPEPVGHAGDAAFPGLTFLQMVTGYRSLEEIRHAFPDCWTDRDEIRGLLETLFPKKSSDLWAVS